mgnify:CR=1 FL=1
MTTDSTPAKKHSLLRKLLYAAAAVILLGSLLASYMHWEANHLELNENTAPGTAFQAFPGCASWCCQTSTPTFPCWKKRRAWQNRPSLT